MKTSPPREAHADRKASIALEAMVLAIAIAACASACGCSKSEPSAPATPAPEAAAEAPEPMSAASGKRVHWNTVPRLLRVPCRALAVTGTVRLVATSIDKDAGAKAIATSAELTDGAWIDLADGASVTVKDPRTTRETKLLGHGRARACVNLKEETWLALGAFESSPGAGEAPGAEEWLVTPFGIVRYGAAQLRVTVTAKEATVLVTNGSASVTGEAPLQAMGDASAPRAPDADGWANLETGAAVRLAGAALSTAGARAATSRCEAAAKDERELAAKIVKTGLDASALTELAPKDVAARASARAACVVAKMRADLLEPSADKDELTKRLAAFADLLGASAPPAASSHSPAAASAPASQGGAPGGHND